MRLMQTDAGDVQRPAPALVSLGSAVEAMLTGPPPNLPRKAGEGPGM